MTQTSKWRISNERIISSYKSGKARLKRKHILSFKWCKNSTDHHILISNNPSWPFLCLCETFKPRISRLEMMHEYDAGAWLLSFKFSKRTKVLTLLHLPPFLPPHFQPELQLINFIRIYHLIKFMREHHPMRYNRMTEILKMVSRTKSGFIIRDEMKVDGLGWK